MSAAPPTGLAETLDRATERLLAERTPGGWWEGHLSASALATATAAFALRLAGDDRHAALVRRGLRWLAAHQNDDGGWGDTVRSRSNVSTTLLAWSALAASPETGDDLAAASRAERWIDRAAGGPRPRDVERAVTARYGRDRTFAVPILTMCALAGRLGEGRAAWRHVPALPFELAALPRSWFAHLRLPVVSYALPALIAIGQVRFRHRPPICPVRRLLRSAACRRTLRVLRDIQPPGGGFLEAAPLTSFVAMSLASIGRRGHAVAADAVGFLERGVRESGAWPIEANLATWVTTLSVKALAAGGALGRLGEQGQRTVWHWLLGQQHRRRHPYTHAEPGGWAWTDLPGGVPDADDAAGAVVALRALAPKDPRARAGAAEGARWLIRLQNRDGGVPTFCRGWGRLPFDRSGADLTAHALLAWRAWRDDLPPELRRPARRAADAALAFLAGAQRDDGAFVPLWFGNEQAAAEANPTYGTARVAMGLAPMAADSAEAARMLRRALAWMLAARGADGGWGGDAGLPPTIEETAVAVDALCRGAGAPGAPASIRPAVAAGARWLVAHTEAGRRFPASPIGCYFARLWYFERLYPLIFAISALARAGRLLES